MKPMRPMLSGTFQRFHDRHIAKQRMLGIKGKLDSPEAVWSNDIYECFVYTGDQVDHGLGDLVITHLSIKRYDRKAIHDWRHLQQIKNDVVGKNYDAVELYPSESRLVDMANQYHLYVFQAPFPLGFNEGRKVGGSKQAQKIGAVQRDW